MKRNINCVLANTTDQEAAICLLHRVHAQRLRGDLCPAPPAFVQQREKKSPLLAFIERACNPIHCTLEVLVTVKAGALKPPPSLHNAPTSARSTDHKLSPDIMLQYLWLFAIVFW